ncbi:hypothetical protein OG982_29855 [Streptomyces sp. NBC_01551]|uniref:hypothetical protein n=1 Tax=Streptomyces sp. NBC_01551 TaxID=2975876 RepID=UPI002258B17B|nr:hypothetical protein [Streptomyces sp. NBC_01551]MCX4529849.1 hypothetical protein [Streptomyces sp. NBC_01551]
MALLTSDPAPPRHGATTQGIIWFGGLILFFFMAGVIFPEIPPALEGYRETALVSSWVGLGGFLSWGTASKAKMTGSKLMDHFFTKFWDRAPRPSDPAASESDAGQVSTEEES